MAESISLLYVTFPNEDEAQKLARQMVEKRLAACTNMLSHMQSTYWWEGKVETSTEVVVIFKTVQSMVSRLRSAIEEAHSYDCPCVLELPVGEANEVFAAWIAQQLKA